MNKRLFSVREIVLVSLFAAVIAISAFMAVPAAIPFTMQIFAVLCAAGLLGAKCAFAAVAVYILLGGVGLPVFSGFCGGVGVLLDVNGGFILGFLPAAFISGLLSKVAKHFFTVFLAMLAGLLSCYIFGCVYFAYLHDAPPMTAFTSAVLPFIPFDVVKALLAALVSIKLRKKICSK